MWIRDAEFMSWFNGQNFPVNNMLAVYAAWQEGRRCPSKETPTMSSLECHDLMCTVADVVVVGGVRR